MYREAESYLSSFWEEFDYPADAREALHNDLVTLLACEGAREELQSILDAYDQSPDICFEDAIKRADGIADAAGISRYAAQFLMFALMTRSLKRYYAEAGYSTELYRRTMLDLRYKAVECKLVKGCWGTFVAGWFPRFFRLERFTFGLLQFETVPFGRTYEKGELHLSPTDTVINVHIPRTGGRLEQSTLPGAFAEAAEFFRDTRPAGRPAVFVCSSWLLYPESFVAYGETSNLRAFSQLFTVIEVRETQSYGEMWRLFDREYTPQLDKMPADSSLRRFYIDRMRRGLPIGSGYGVYVLQNEKK